MAEKAERRLAAILAADVVGYSRLIAADEEGTLARLRDIRASVIDPKIDEHRGRIVKLMGDGALVEFASVVDAVRCAVEIQRDMEARNAGTADHQRMVFRIGVNLGDIVVEDDDIHGDGVNIAARLEGLAEPGGITISGTAYDHVRDRLDVAFDDIGEQTVKNIPRPVRAYRVRLAPDAAEGDAAPGKRRGQTWRLRWMMAGAAGAAIAAAVVVLVLLEPWVPREEPADPAKMAFALPDKPSIAVLPFDNLSDDPDWFADGMTDNLITDLSKVPGLFVIARNSTFTYKGRAVKVRQVAEELGVRYVLEGSVQRAGGQVRINAQLIDATTGGHVWSDRFDRANEDLFALQDEVIGEIIAALPIVSPPDTKPSRAPTANLDAYDFYLRGKQTLDNLDIRDLNRSIEMFELALELDPEFALARAAIARAYSNMGQYGLWRTDNDPDVDLGAVGYVGALEILQRALADDPELALAHALRARMWMIPFTGLDEGRFAQARKSAERAFALAPNDADVLVDYAVVLSASGEHMNALETMQEALRLNPRPPPRYAIDLGWILFHMERYSEAVQSATQFQEEVSYGFVASELLAAAHAHMGDLDEARTHLAIVLENRPQFHLEKSDKGLWKWTIYEKGVDRGRIIEGLRLAGAPIFENGVEPRGTQLQQDEIEGLLVGQTISGRDVISGVQWWRTQANDGTARHWDSEGTDQTGRFTVEDGWACWEWDVADDFKRCNRVYRDPTGTAKRLDEYLMAGTGCICSFAVEQPEAALPLPDKPSIAVLPFNNLSRDPDEDYFVDGMTETLITDLSRIPELFVIARNTSFTYKGKAVDVKAVGRELGVRYVLEGSVQRAGARVRINAQLIDTQTGGHTWSDRFDRANDDIFALQDEVVARIIAALLITTAEAEPSAQRYTDNLEAYDYYLRGRQTLYSVSREGLASAVENLKKAVALDPTFARAHAALADAYARIRRGNWWNYHDPDSLWIEARDAGFHHAAIAESLDQSIAQSQIALAGMHFERATLLTIGPLGRAGFDDPHRYDAALDAAERAVGLEPNDADGYNMLAVVLASDGQHERARAMINLALRLNPRPPAEYYYTLSLVEFQQRDYVAAVESGETYQEMVPQGVEGLWVIAAAQAYLGRAGEARRAIDMLIRERSSFGLRQIDSGPLRWFSRFADFAHLYEGLRLAGAPLVAGGFTPPGDGYLSHEDVERLIVDRTIAGIDMQSSKAWWSRQSADGAARRWQEEGTETVGTFAVEDGWACWVWENSQPFKNCSRIFRAPWGKPEKLDEYVAVGTGCGADAVAHMCSFSIEEAD